VGPQELVTWTGGTSYQDLTARIPEHSTSGFTIPRSPNSRRGDGTIEKSKLRAHRSFSTSGLGSWRNELLDAVSVELVIGEAPKG
jgi:hypothetical protein